MSYGFGICALYFSLTIGLYTATAKAEHGPATWAAASGSVVVVNPTWPGYSRPGYGAPAGTAPAGSGVYFDNDQAETGFILTAAHVVRRATYIEIVNAKGVGAPAEIYAIDEKRDIAVLTTKLTGPSITKGDDEMPVGTHVCVIGNSFGLGNSLSCGVVSAIHRRDIGFNDVEDFIQTDAAVNSGGSGGALVNAEGHFVGLVDGIFTKNADIDAGVNFAISLSLIQNSLAEMRARGLDFSKAN